MLNSGIGHSLRSQPPVDVKIGQRPETSDSSKKRQTYTASRAE